MTAKHIYKYTKIAQAIKELRKSKGLTQEQLASKIGISKSYISKIEAPNCYKSFSLEVLFEIADALDTHITQLFKYV